ncbi:MULTISPECIES: FadR/GntR family transcriptional regulator [Microbacterium]|uniref:FadR/GntR family transcriptional regulator n=1 Tax=Microbacterium TaxID=33882 RepID=UPI00217E0F87|nr:MULTISPECIES: GntR family transcriptional regulator [Microbacterium]UWF78325.1 FadR family transcriptional regulator [Microbacterium neungamense]WCM56502.1 FadR family transcriptional regulator [Microbacterium sp. EF45047]
MDPLTTASGARPHRSGDGRSRQPHRIQGAVFQPIGDEGRAELVERRLVEAITRGHLRAGERLPSESELARSFGVAPVTVREALLAVRGRGLIVTRRGRNGGSFVADDADPLAHARDAVLSSSRLALRDMGAHYGAITSAAIRLAARRADPSETTQVRGRLERMHELDAEQQLRLLDDVQVELVSLSQSARLTREQMKLQAEFSPFLRLVAPDEEGLRRRAEALRGIIDAVEAGDADDAGRRTEQMVADAIDALIQIQTRVAAEPR